MGRFCWQIYWFVKNAGLHSKATERGKVVYRCATRMDKGREACGSSPTIEENWIKEELGKRICDGEYVEEKVRKIADEIRIGKDGALKIERK